MNLGDLLPVFAATDAAAASAERNGKFTEFPDEEPTVKQMNDWLEVNLPVITKSHGELMRGALPPALIQLKAEADADLTDYVAVTIDTTTAKTTMEGVRQLTQVQKFQQSQFDPCYFWKHLSDGTRLDIVMYVDDGYAVDATSKAAEAELKQLNDAFKLTLKPAAFFLGNNVTVHDGAQGGAP